jgi:uncharacterized RDD family membrane protein YckC
MSTDSVSVGSAVPTDAHAYARFTRRLQAVLVDVIIFMLIFAGALVIAVSLKSDNVARVLGFTVVATWLLYEPILVSTTGGTLGHLLYNLRVVDDNGGNVGFGKAVIRVVIKTVLGWYSFITMALTRRHQAVHDLLTKSTVQIRDLGKAQPHHFSARRAQLTPPGVPSVARRLVVIACYLLACFVLFTAALPALAAAGAVSMQCIDGRPCSGSELLILSVLWLGWAGTSLLAVVRAWQGRMWGARASSTAG